MVSGCEVALASTNCPRGVGVGVLKRAATGAGARWCSGLAERNAVSWTGVSLAEVSIRVRTSRAGTPGAPLANAGTTVASLGDAPLVNAGWLRVADNTGAWLAVVPASTAIHFGTWGMAARQSREKIPTMPTAGVQTRVAAGRFLFRISVRRREASRARWTPAWTHGGMKEEQGADNFLDQVGPVVAATQMREFVKKNCVEIFWRKFTQGPGWQDNRPLPEADGCGHANFFGDCD